MRRIVAAGLLLAAGAVAAGVVLYRAKKKEDPQPAPPVVVDDPRATFDSPFVNIRPDVAYVGDAACFECHKTIAASYAGHPMGRSMALGSSEKPEATVKNSFEKNGFVYRVEYRGGKMFHREERLDAAGKVVAATECEAKYAVGSSTRGKSYLVERHSRPFQSPI